MTTEVSVINDALQKIGTRTTIASLGENSNEAIQANLALTSTRDELLRTAPWNCATNHALLEYITSVPGTPENRSTNLSYWAKGVPPPGWAYEYQYPVDCLRPLFLVPQLTTGFAGGVPITQAVTGATATTWRRGPPIRFNVSVDQFRPVTAAAVQASGTGHIVGDIITLAGTPLNAAPIGAPVKLRVETVTGSAIQTVSVINQVAGSPTPQGGSYFAPQTNPVAQALTTGIGTGATFNLTFGPASDQRVILTQQENAICCYVRQVTDPNVMDPLFLDAWSSLIGSKLAIALTGDKNLANMQIQLANNAIMEARKADGNEGLTVMDHTPDWIRTRGTYFPLITGWSSDVGFDWGNLFPSY